MKIKTSELEGAALDFAVCITQGWQLDPLRPASEGQMIRKGKDDRSGAILVSEFPYSVDWVLGGPLIEEYLVFTAVLNHEWAALYLPQYEGKKELAKDSCLEFNHHDVDVYIGPTALIAAMRAIVASELGDEVDVPEELIK